MIGVPSILDQGALVIEVTAIQQNRDNQQRIVSSNFIIQIQPSDDNQFLWSQEPSKNSAAIKIGGSWIRNNKFKAICELDKNVYHANLVLDTSLNELDAKQRVKLIYKLANFISHSASRITMETKKSETVSRLLDKRVVVAAGPGNAHMTTDLRGVELSWVLECGENVTQLENFIQVIEHNISTGRITREINFDLIGWKVTKTQSPTPFRKLRRQRRQAVRLPIPTRTVLFSTPTILVATSSINSLIQSEYLDGSDQFMKSSTHLLASASVALSRSSSVLKKQYYLPSSDILLPSSQLDLSSSTESPVSLLSTSELLVEVFTSSVEESNSSSSSEVASSSASTGGLVFSVAGSVLTSADELSSVRTIMTSKSLMATTEISLFSIDVATTIVEMPSTDTSLDSLLSGSSLEGTSKVSSLIAPTPALTDHSSEIASESLLSFDDRTMPSTPPNVTILSSEDMSSISTAETSFMLQTISDLSVVDLRSTFVPKLVEKLKATVSKTSENILNSSSFDMLSQTANNEPSSVMFMTNNSNLLSPMFTVDSTTVLQLKESVLTSGEQSLLVQTSSTTDVTPILSSLEKYEITSFASEINQVSSSVTIDVIATSHYTGQEPLSSAGSESRTPVASATSSLALISEEANTLNTQFMPDELSATFIAPLFSNLKGSNLSKVSSDSTFPTTQLLPEGNTASSRMEESSTPVVSSDSVLLTPLPSPDVATDIINASESIFSTAPHFSQEMSISSMLVSSNMLGCHITFENLNAAESLCFPLSSIETSVTLSTSLFQSSAISSTGIFSRFAGPNFTLVGPPRATKLTVVLEPFSSSLGAGVYASAGYEKSDDIITITTGPLGKSSDDAVTEKYAETVTNEILPTYTSVYTEELVRTSNMLDTFHATVVASVTVTMETTLNDIAVATSAGGMETDEISLTTTSGLIVVPSTTEELLTESSKSDVYTTGMLIYAHLIKNCRMLH